ncbi:unnamed protein product [Fraxinus pennsylvanica]|uniref:Uncharacterized protein n=1 Tax=Fraxinus pennsylvanica TaxID=56036 RepID=A0AAD1ZH70_9LAMI|nr:unnamed protein product [Fraxinus pennsylvanica]
MEVSITTTWVEPPRPGWGSVKKALMSSVRWSEPSKWEVHFSGNGKEGPTPLLVRGNCAGDFGWQSHSSTSPVWQMPILIGEKRKLPRFSGLVLYDKRERALDHCEEGSIDNQIASSSVKFKSQQTTHSSGSLGYCSARLAAAE